MCVWSVRSDLQHLEDNMNASDALAKWTAEKEMDARDKKKKTEGAMEEEEVGIVGGRDETLSQALKVPKELLSLAASDSFLSRYDDKPSPGEYTSLPSFRPPTSFLFQF